MLLVTDTDASTETGLSAVLLRPIRGANAFEATVEQLGHRDPARHLRRRRPAAARARARRVDGGQPGDASRGHRGAAPGRPGRHPHWARRRHGRHARGSGRAPTTSRADARPPSSSSKPTSTTTAMRWSSAAWSSPAPRTRPRPETSRRPARPGCAPRWSRSSTASDPALHRQADSRFHLAMAKLSGSPRLLDLVTDVQRDLHDMLTAIPVLAVNITHSNDEHKRIAGAILSRRPPTRPASSWRPTATAPQPCSAACSACKRHHPEGTDPHA